MRPDAPIDERFAGRTVVIQGASRGLGLEMARQLLALPSPPRRVFATCRDPTRAQELQQLLLSSSSSPRLLTVLQLDVTDPASIERAAKTVEEELSSLAAAGGGGAGAGVDFLLNTSGVLHDRASGLVPETSVSRVDPDALARMFAVNATGPLMVARAFLPLVARGAGGAGPDAPPAVIAALSARVGSISDNGLGGWFSYRASKAALNQLYKTLSVEVGRRYAPKSGGASGGGGGARGGVAVVLLHPGTCDTSLTKPYQGNVPPEKLFTVERGARQLLGLVASASTEDNGRFVDWKGEVVPW
jgi:NAD(P)-dependent dehydrogenase (short-subunit alcohol dehydrogenase family)